MQLQCKRTLSAEQLHTGDIRPCVVCCAEFHCEGAIKCSTQDKCYTTKERCDGISQCDDASDEFNCSSKRHQCYAFGKNYQVKIVHLVLPK